MWVPLHKQLASVRKRKREVDAVLDPEPEEVFRSGFRSGPGLEKLHHVDVKCDALPGFAGHSCIQGRRVNMEDRYIMDNFNSIDNHSLLAIFDGHGGVGAADYCSSNLLSILEQNEHWLKYVNLMGKNSNKSKTSDKMISLISKALVEAYIELDKGFLLSSYVDEFDSKFDQHKKMNEVEFGSIAAVLVDRVSSCGRICSGCTAVCSVITPTHVIVANCGDSRCIISGMDKSSKEGIPVYTTITMTDDHKPENSEENERITDAGGFVMGDRVDGCLAMSRAIGDFEFKCDPSLGRYQQKVICIPDIAVHERRLTPHTGISLKHAHVHTGNELSKKHKIDTDSSDILLLACDGVAEVIDDNVKVISHVRECIAKEKASGKRSISYSDISRKLIEHAHGLFSTDNISVIVAPLQLS